jgi:LPXTG-motif cell wall-anchored protein
MVLEAENIEPGATRMVEWIISDAGTYQRACHVEGHYAAGMKTAFTATVPAAAAAPVAAPAAAPAAEPAAPVAELPKTGEAYNWWPIIFGLLALITLAGGIVLRVFMRRLIRSSFSNAITGSTSSAARQSPQQHA